MKQTVLQRAKKGYKRVLNMKKMFNPLSQEAFKLQSVHLASFRGAVRVGTTEMLARCGERQTWTLQMVMQISQSKTVFNVKIFMSITYIFILTYYLSLTFLLEKSPQTWRESIPSLSAVSRGFDFNVKIFRSLQLAETIIPSNDWNTAPLNISLVKATRSMHRLHH